MREVVAAWMDVCGMCERVAHVQTICQNAMNIYLQLNLADRGGGGGRNSIETP